MRFEREHFSSDMDGSLVFTISDEKGNAVTKLDIMHERPMHVVLVRDDLKYFDHIHPVLEGTSWVVNADFLAPGSYRLWVDFTKNMQQHLVDFDFFVDGESEPEPDSLDNLRVNIDAPEYIMVGQPVPLRFFVGGAIKDRAIPVKETFLGAAAHLVVIDSTLTEFLHDHDMTFDDDHILSFTPTFSSAGLYRAWVQFSVWGKDRTASFEFMVQGEEHHEET